MKMRPVLTFCLLVSAAAFAHAQASGSSDIDQLREQVALQAKQLQAQQKQIDALQFALKAISSAKPAPDPSAAFVSAPSRGDNQRTASAEQANPTVAASQAGVTDSPEAPNPPAPFDPDQELDVEEQETGPALKLGPARVQLLGYVALTGLFRSTNSGGNVGTNFGGIPPANTSAGNISELRLSPQSTRLAIRADADLGQSKVSGYFEM